MQYKYSLFIPLLEYKVQNESDFFFLFTAIFLVPKIVPGTEQLFNQCLPN